MSQPKFKIMDIYNEVDEHVIIFYDDFQIGSFWLSDPGSMIEDIPEMIKKLAQYLDIEIEEIK